MFHRPQPGVLHHAGLLTLHVDQDTPGVEDAVEEDHQGMEDQDPEAMEDLVLVMEDQEVLSDI